MSKLLEENDAADLLLPLHHHAKQAGMAVDEAVTEALDLVKMYADPEHPAWKDGPDKIYQELDQARDSIVKAWDDLQTAVATKQEGDAGDDDDDDVKETEADTDKEGLRVAFIDMITDAFADVLDNLRQNSANDPVDVEVLVDCLQSGLDLMNTSTTGSGSIGDFTSFDEGGDADTAATATITPHESRRRQLGFRQLNDMAA